MVIPLLELEPLAQALAGSLPSEAECLQLIWGHVNSNFSGFKGVASISCKVVGRKSIFPKPGGWVELGNHCLLFKVKERWVESGFPTFLLDKHIIRKLINLKASFDKKKNNPRIKAEEKERFVNKLKTTTMNLAPLDWERTILREQFLTASTNRERVRVLQDYIGDQATRYKTFI